MRQNVFGGMKKKEKKTILAAPYYKLQCSKPGKKVAAYSPEFTVIKIIKNNFILIFQDHKNLPI